MFLFSPLLSSPLLFSSLVGIGNRELGEYSLFVNKSRQMGKSVQLMWFGYPPKGRQYQTTNQINSIRGKMKSGSTGGAGCGKTKKKEGELDCPLKDSLQNANIIRKARQPPPRRPDLQTNYRLSVCLSSKETRSLPPSHRICISLSLSLSLSLPHLPQ